MTEGETRTQGTALSSAAGRKEAREPSPCLRTKSYKQGVYTKMKTLAKILSVISLISLLLTGIGVIVYYAIEFISSFCISTINLVEIGNIFWKIVFICFGSAVFSFVLAYLIKKKYE